MIIHIDPAMVFGRTVGKTDDCRWYASAEKYVNSDIELMSGPEGIPLIAALKLGAKHAPGTDLQILRKIMLIKENP